MFKLRECENIDGSCHLLRYWINVWLSEYMALYSLNHTTLYVKLARSGDYTLAPVAVETLGTWGPSALELCKEIGGRIARCTGDTRFIEFLRQRLSIAVQKGNAAAVLWAVDDHLLRCSETSRHCNMHWSVYFRRFNHLPVFHMTRHSWYLFHRHNFLVFSLGMGGLEIKRCRWYKLSNQFRLLNQTYLSSTTLGWRQLHVLISLHLLSKYL